MTESDGVTLEPQEAEPLEQEVKELKRAQSREDFTQFENIVNMPRGSHMPKRVAKDEPDNRSYDEDNGGGIGNCLASLLQVPVMIAGAIIVPIFGLVFVICGIVFLTQCKLEPMIPIWLLVQGFILLFGIGFGGFAKKTSKDGNVNIVIKIVGFIMFMLTFAWFVAGNFFVYNAWAKNPDYGHFWFEAGCNPALFNLALTGIIVLDCLFALSFVVGIIAFILRGCKRN